MIKRPIESQDQILQSTLPALRVIPILLSSTLHAMQNSQTLQQFLSPLYALRYQALKLILHLDPVLSLQSDLTSVSVSFALKLSRQLYYRADSQL